LTDEQRQVVLLKFIEGYNNEEISKIMKKSIGAVKLLQFRALKALRKFFKKQGYEYKA
jgi:RNA polymerase sigma-70 factor (ECF subfamily)